MKPILNDTITNTVEDILAPFKDPARWMALNLHFSPVPYAIVMLIGEPGTGKSTLARYMARRITPKRLIEVSFGEVANSELGATEQAINKVFDEAEKDNALAMLLDECDAILWNRDRITEHSMHMLSIVNTTLIRIDRFTKRGGLICMATNHPGVLDPALIRRITDTITLFPLVGEQCAKVWRSKLPRTMRPPTKEELHVLSKYPITPSRMEAAVLSACRRAFREERAPRISDLFTALDN